MFDLIDECGEDLKSLGYEETMHGKFSLRVGKIDVDSNEKSKRTGFDRGTYIIYNCPLLHGYGQQCFDYVCQQICKGLRLLKRKNNLTKSSRILMVGLGNPAILSDSIGPKVLDRMDLEVFKKPLRIFKFAPNIFVNTGINSFDAVNMLAIWLDVDAVCIIDALGTDSPSRLTTSIQINDVGMTPASAVNNLGNKLCEDSLGVPCISIGVPTMLLAGKVSPEFPEKLILTPKDIHSEINNLSKIISQAISLTM